MSRQPGYTIVDVDEEVSNHSVHVSRLLELILRFFGSIQKEGGDMGRSEPQGLEFKSQSPFPSTD